MATLLLTSADPRLAGVALACLLLISFHCSSIRATEFPLRSQYPNLNTLSTTELFLTRNECAFIDVRSSLEYEVIHIRSAKLIPLGRRDFQDQVMGYRNATGLRCIAFYCNGKTCNKSYEAASKMGNIKDVFVYDAGVFEWAQAYPYLTQFMEKPLNDPKKLISIEAYQTRQISLEEALSMELQVIDVRSFYQRKGAKLPFSKVQRIPMERIGPLLKNRIIQDQNLLFIDSVGRQNQWLQYYLEEAGYQDYRFLEGGAAAIQ